MVNAVQLKPTAPLDLEVSLAELPLPAALVDELETVLAANSAFFDEIGSAGGDVLGQSIRDVIAQASGGVVRDAYRLDGPSGERWLRIDIRPLTAGSLAFLTDVTAEVLAYERLKSRTLARDQLLLDAEIGAWHYDPDTQTYNFSDELALGHKNISEPVPLAKLELIQHRDDRAIDRDIRDRLTSEGGWAEAEMRYLDGRGGWRHLRALYRSGRMLPSGQYEMFGLSQNITDLAQSRDEANILAQRLRLALTAGNAGVFELDFKRKSIWASAEFKRLVGDEDLSDDPADLYGIFHPDDRDSVRGLLTDQDQILPDPVDVRVLRPDAEPLWTRLCWQTQDDASGRPRRGVGLLLDIDQQKRQEMALTAATEAAESAMESRSNFLASVSHEIRTPMNGIVGVLHLLEREALSDEGRDMLAEALNCSDMLSQLINDVLDFSKMEAGKLEIAPSPTDPAAVLNSVIAMLHAQADGKNLYLRAVPTTDGFAMIDPVRLRQCLFNTIGNAVKFTQAGGVEVRMAFVDEGPARRLRCEVEDTGIGISEVAQRGLFGRFQQADGGANRKFGGTGLGLAISRSLARMMGGDMGFDSQEGVGSTFWFEIAAPPAEAPIAQPELAHAAPLEGLRLLIVDDNRTNRLVGMRALEALGAGVETAESGETAIRAVERGRFDLVLMDINMPDMDGMEATGHIRALAGEAAQVPIIALTADVMTHHQQAYLACGMNGFVPKPFTPTALLSEIARLAG